MREGFGSEMYTNNDTYIGEWRTDEWEGDGILMFGSTGNRYAGQFQNGLPNGFGQYNTVEGIIYTGDLRDSMYNGHGHLSEGKQYYEGEWRSGMRDGYGIQVFEDKAFYLGYWVLGTANGQGLFWQPDGLTYIGEWKNGYQEGWGTLI